MEATSKAERLAHHFQERIDSGELAEGHFIGTKKEILENFNVAVGTLNESLRLLQTRGYLEVKPGPNGGAFVANEDKRIRLRHTLIYTTGNPDDVSHALQVRDALEPLVAAEAARFCQKKDAEQINEAERAISLAEDETDLLRRIWRFHRVVAAVGRNPILTSIYINLLDTIEQSLQSVEMTASVPRGVSNETIEVHRNLAAAICRNDVEGAIKAAHEHSPIGDSSYEGTS